MADDESWVLLRDYGSAMEANLDLASLEMESVPTLVRGLEPGIWGPGFTGGLPRGVQVYVPASLIETARDVIGDDPPSS